MFNNFLVSKQLIYFFTRDRNTISIIIKSAEQLFVDNIWKKILSGNLQLAWLNMSRKYVQSVEIHSLNYKKVKHFL